MAPRCSICSHPQRVEIDKALIAGGVLRDVAQRFATSRDALFRHKRDHLAEQIERAERQHAVTVERRVRQQEQRKDDDALDVMTELRRTFERINLLFDACDRWLRDPDDPTRYDIGPRAFEIGVVYEETVPGPNGKQRVVNRKATLQELIDRTRGVAGDGIHLVETKHADPRDLVIKAAAQLKGQTEFLARLIGQLDERPQINFLLIPEWQALRAEIVKALRPYPDAKAAVAGRMLALKAGGDE